MNTLHLTLFMVLSTMPNPVAGSTDKQCPSGLPTELMLDCISAVRAASTDESGRNDFGLENYNLVESLQQWMDRQMRADAIRDEFAEPVGSDVAQQQDEH